MFAFVYKLAEMQLQSTNRPDRTDLHIEVPALEYRDVGSELVEENSNAIRERIGRARQCQQD